MIFVNSMSDLFHEDIPIWFIDRVFAVMAMADQHIFQVLTKRPERMREYFDGYRPDGERHAAIWAQAVQHWAWTEQRDYFHFLPLPNVWLGVSVENQETANERIPLLLKTPAAVRWISAEPLLGPVDLNQREWIIDKTRFKYTLGCYLDWVVVGGESGPKARPFTLGMGMDIIRQCVADNVPVFMKQTGNNPVSLDGKRWPNITGKGHDPLEWPAEMRVQEYPI